MTIDWAQSLVDVAAAAAFTLLFLAILLAAKWFRGLLSPFNHDEELVKRDNPALGLALGGYFIAVCLVFVGAVSGPATDLATDLLTVAGYAALGVLLLNAADFLLDKFTLTDFPAESEVVEKRNLGIGAVKAAFYIATGLIAGGAVSGEGGGVAATLVFFVIGQATLFLAARLYETITPFRVQDELASGNTAAAVAFSGTIVAIGIILGDAVSGDFLGWRDGLIWYAKSVVVCLIALPIARFLMDKLILIGGDINREISEDKNLAAGFVEAAVAVSAALVIASLI